MPSVTEGHDTPFPRDPPKALFPPLQENYQNKQKKPHSTTTTIKPPPWLVTNKTSVVNVTLPPPVTTVKTTTTSTFKFPITTTLRVTPPPPPVVPTQGDHPRYYQRGANRTHQVITPDKSTNEILRQEDENHKKLFMTSTISSASKFINIAFNNIVGKKPSKPSFFEWLLSRNYWYTSERTDGLGQTT